MNTYVQRMVFALGLAFTVAGSAAAQKDSASHKPAPKVAAARTVWPDEGPRTWAPRPTVPAITANDLRARLYQISDDSGATPPVVPWQLTENR